MSTAAVPAAVLALLGRCGLGAAALAGLGRRAAETGSPVDVIAVSEGLVTHATLMATLAEVLHCAYLDDLSALSLEASLQSFLGEAVRLRSPDGLAVLACPSGEAIAYLLSDTSRPRPWLVLTSRERFRERLRVDLAEDMAAMASQTPEQRASGGAIATEATASLMQRLAVLLVMLAAPIAFLFWMGPPGLPVLAIALAPLFLLKVILRLSAAAARVDLARPQALLDDARLPGYAVIVPLYREATVVPQLIEALSSLDYPRCKLSVLLVLEQEDHKTLAALRRIALPPWIEVVVAPDGQPRTKPRALNIALAQTNARLVTIFDAEDLPDPDQLRMAATFLLRGPRQAGAYQAVLDVDNGRDSLIAGLFALEYAALFRLINPYLHSVGLPFLLGGTSNHFRRSDLLAIGGWDAANLTEDAEIGVRLLRNGQTLLPLPSRTQEEAPIAWRNWRRQRVRWMKGFMQTLWALAASPIRLARTMGIAPFLTTVVLLAGTVLSALCLPFAWLALAIVMIHEPWPGSNDIRQAAFYSVGLVLFVSGVAAMVYPAVVAARSTVTRHGRATAWLMPFYAWALSLSGWIAVGELIRRPLYWDKTDHGLSPSRRMRAKLRRDGRNRAVNVEQTGHPPPAVHQIDRR